MKKFFHLYKYPIVLVGLALVLSFANYKSGTWLTGWDDLHPEFNFAINIERVFFSAWEKFQGLGLASAMAHASDLPRTLILAVLGVIFDASILRYMWQFLMLISGPVGMYFFAKRVVAASKPSHSLVEFLAFCSGLYYLLNLATLQNFYAPQDMFTTQYGFLPWLLLYFIEYLNDFDPRTLLKYALVTILASTQAFTPTLALSYFMMLGLAFVYFIVRNKFNFSWIKKSLGIVLTTILLNSFWLVPFGYFVTTGAKNVPDASINVFSSDESFYLNKKYGTLRDVLVLRGFWFENTDYNQSAGGFRPMFQEWIEHQSSIWVAVAGYSLAGLMVLGVLFIFVDRREVRYPGLLVLFLAVPVFFLLNANPPLGQVFTFLQDEIPLFKEAFRFPFTKFSIIAAFSYSMFFGLGCLSVLKLIKRFLPNIELLLATAFVAVCVLWMLPAFQGYLMSPNLRVKIPEQYFQLFEWFSRQDPDTRILNTPMYSYWAWPYHDWGYRGSGFLWYGIKQPILDRAFDVWSPRNEEVYWQISNALYSNDSAVFTRLLDKYAVKWILVDSSIFVPGRPNSREVLGYDQIQKLTSDSTNFSLAFESGSLKVFEYKGNASFVAFTDRALAIGGEKDFSIINHDDRLYVERGTYYYSDDGMSSIEFPFAQLNVSNLNSADEELIVTAKIQSSPSRVFIPNALEFEDVLPSEVAVAGNELMISTLPVRVFSEGGEKSQIAYFWKTTIPSQPRVGDYIRVGEKLFRYNGDGVLGQLYIEPSAEIYIGVYDFDSNPEADITRDLSLSGLGTCGVSAAGSYSVTSTSSGITLQAVNNTGCVSTTLETNKAERILQVAFDYQASNSYPKYCLYDSSSGKCLNDLEKYRIAEIDRVGQVLDFIVVGETAGVQGFNLYLTPLPDTEAEISYSNVRLREGSEIFSAKILPARDFILGSGSSNIVVSAPELDFHIPVVKQDQKHYFEDDFSDSRRFSYDNVCIVDRDRPFSTETGILNLYASNSEACFYTVLGDLGAGSTYLLSIDSRRISGKDQRLCVISSEDDRCLIPYKVLGTDTWFGNKFLIPNLDNPEEKLALLVNNTSIGSDPSEYDYDNLRVLPLPYGWLGNVQVMQATSAAEGITARQNSATGLDFSGNLFSYKLKSPLPNSGLIILNQSFDPLWKAFCGFRVCTAEHVEVNGWANGWIINDNNVSNMRFVYVLAYIQIFSYFAVLGTVFVLFAMVIRRRRLTKNHS